MREAAEPTRDDLFQIWLEMDLGDYLEFDGPGSAGWEAARVIWGARATSYSWTAYGSYLDEDGALRIGSIPPDQFYKSADEAEPIIPERRER